MLLNQNRKYCWQPQVIHIHPERSDRQKETAVAQIVQILEEIIEEIDG